MSLIQGDTIPAGFLKEALRTLVVDAFCYVFQDWQHGPLHIILADDNVEDGNIAFCRKQLEEHPTARYTVEISHEELDAMARFLDYLEGI